MAIATPKLFRLIDISNNKKNQINYSYTLFSITL